MLNQNLVLKKIIGLAAQSRYPRPQVLTRVGALLKTLAPNQLWGGGEARTRE